MRALPGKVFMKTGAEGVYCGAFPEHRLGFAVKIDDGAKRAAAGVAMALVERFYPSARGLMPYGPIGHGAVPTQAPSAHRKSWNRRSPA